MLPYSTQAIGEDDIKAVVEVLKSPSLVQDKKVKEFEDNLCSYTGAKHAIAFNSATSALFGSYMACGIGEGDEIITSPISFVSTSNMFVALNAKPVWCDVKDDGNIDEELIEALITPKTKAIVPIHYAGKPVEIQKIHNIAKKHNLLVIEDAAHALGSSIDGKKIGSLSDMTIFSFHAIKPITTSEGGAVLTDNDKYAKSLRLIRSNGMIKKELWDSDMPTLGFNFRMTEIAGALGVSQLKKLDDFIKKRNKIVSYYDERFKDEKSFKTLALEKNLKSSRHLYPILLNTQLTHAKKEIYKELLACGYGVQIHYKPIYKNSFYIEKFADITLKNVEKFYAQEIPIPCHQKMNLDDAKKFADILLNILHKYAKRV